jgi:parvulin-like peptidyl-prolyl isomerase
MKILFTLLLVFSANAFSASNSIVAIINNDIITLQMLEAQTQEKINKLKKLDLLNQQIIAILQIQKAKELNIRPKPNSINKVLNNIAIRHKINLDQLQQLPEFKQILQNITQQLTLLGLKKFIIKKADTSLTQDEIDNALKNSDQPTKPEHWIKLSKIIINSIENGGLSGKDKEFFIKNKLLEIKTQVESGEDFSVLARLHSQDSSYKKGGKLGWINIKKLSSSVKQQLKKLGVGKVSDPFYSKQGSQLLYVNDIKTDNKHLKRIKAKLIKQKQVAFFTKWVEKLKENAYISIFKDKL